MNEPPASERELARALRLRGDPPPVTRLSRKALALLGGVAALAIAGTAGWALSGHRGRPAPPDTGETAEAPRPPATLTALPKDYASLPPGTPRLGPPLPGDLGRPILLAEGQAPADAGYGRAPAAKTVGAAEQQRLSERQQALGSRLFGVSGVASPPPAAPVSLPTIPTIASPVAGIQAGVAADRRTAFLEPRRNSDPVNPARLQAPASPYSLQAGSVIQAALITGVQSDLPGEVTAQVTEDVFDSLTGDILLIPQGARLIGIYDSQVGFGQNRVLLVWTRLILPDGRSVDLGRELASDPQGFAGLSDGVDHKWRQIAGAALVSTILGVGTELGATTEDSQIAQALRNGAANALSQAGQQLVGRTLEIQPTLTIRPGFPVRVMLTRDLVLEPWSRS